MLEDGNRASPPRTSAGQTLRSIITGQLAQERRVVVPDDDPTLPKIGDAIPASSGPAWSDGGPYSAEQPPVFVPVGLDGFIVGYTRTLWSPASLAEALSARPILNGSGEDIGYFGPDGVPVIGS
jgi:hypothetical protein